MENEMKCIDYYNDFLSKEFADECLKVLSSLDYTSELTTLDGEKVNVPREMIYLSDEAVDYPYANLILKGKSWNEIKIVSDLKDMIESKTGAKFNGVLMNKYRDGNDTINWHSDSEKQLGEKPTIASLNLGAERIFKFKLKEDKKIKNEFLLEHGSLFIMKDDCQEKWLHSIRRDSSVKTERLNLTFRYYYV